jgi:biopolymer transport protein ExbD
MRARRTPQAGLEPALPITPMLDMAFQLLAFFIFTYHPSDLEGQMEVDLAARGDPGPAVVDRPPPDGDLAVAHELTVVVRAHDGTIGALSVEDRAGRKPVADLAGLREHLAGARRERPDESAVCVRGEGRLRWGEMVRVVDACREAGFPRVAFAAPGE